MADLEPHENVKIYKLGGSDCAEEDFDSEPVIGSEFFNLDGSKPILHECDFDHFDIQSAPSSHEVRLMEEACESNDLSSVEDCYKSIQKRFAGCYNIALAKGNASIAEFLLKQSIYFDPIHFRRALEQKNYEILQLFLDHGFQINVPLNWDAPETRLTFGDEALTRWFLAHGADPNAACELDKTSLSLAVWEAPLPIIKLLFEFGGTVATGQLLHHVARRKKPDCIAVLNLLWEIMGPAERRRIDELMYQDQPHSFGLQEWRSLGTPLHEAASADNLPMIEALIAKGADPNIRDSRGDTVIERADRMGHWAISDRLRNKASGSI